MNIVARAEYQGEIDNTLSVTTVSDFNKEDRIAFRFKIDAISNKYMEKIMRLFHSGQKDEIIKITKHELSGVSQGYVNYSN